MEGTAPDTSDGCTKIDAPMMVPTTIAVARPRPMARTSWVAGRGPEERKRTNCYLNPKSGNLLRGKVVSTLRGSVGYHPKRPRAPRTVPALYSMPPTLESAFQLLFKYRPAVFAEGDLAFGVGGPIAVGLGAATLALCAAILTYRRVGAHSTARDRAVLALIRGAVLLVVVACLFRPMLLLSSPVPQRNFVGVIVDDSRSMQIADDRTASRADVIRSALGTSDSSLIAALRERFQVRLFKFGSSVQRITDLTALGFDGVETRVGDAISNARQELDAVPLSGLVILSDGADNASQAVGAELLSLRARSVPVFTVGIGAERFQRDAEIERVELPRQVLAGTSFIANVIVRQRGFEGDKVMLVVEDDGRVIAQEEIEMPPDGAAAPVRIPVTVRSPGARTLRFAIPLQSNEQVSQNNERRALLDVRHRREKILYVEGEPRPEVAFLRRAVEADSNLQLVVLQRTAENKFLRLNVDGEEELASGFPSSRAELFKYRGIVLGSIEASAFSADQLRMLADFVSVRGGGMLFLGGRRAFGEGGYAGTPLADILPSVRGRRRGAGLADAVHGSDGAGDAGRCRPSGDAARRAAAPPRASRHVADRACPRLERQQGLASQAGRDSVARGHRRDVTASPCWPTSATDAVCRSRCRSRIRTSGT